MDIRKKLEQIRRNKKNKNKPNRPTTTTKSKAVEDLRQIIAKKTKRKEPKSRDLRETNKKLTSRATRPTSTSRTETSRPATRLTKRTASNEQAAPHPSFQARGYPDASAYQQQQYYVPPHMRHNQSAYVMTPQQADSRRSNPVVSASAAPRQGNASILISNLHPKITQSEIIELCSDIGPMSGLNFINQSTVIATFQNSSDAVKAVKIYNNRLLDGRPMSVNMMPNLV